MLRNFLRVARDPSVGRLVKKNFFNFYNQVPKFDASKDYYKILDVTKDSSESEIKKSYYKLAKIYHPDSNPGQESKFKEINEAYSVLSDANLRKQYNSARSFQGFSRQMGNKAKEGHYNYEEYRSMYSNLSPQEQAAVLQQMKKKMRVVLFVGVAMIFILPFLTRRNHRYFIVNNGELVPVEFEGGMMGGMAPPPGVLGPYGQAPYPAQAPYPGQAPYGGQPQAGYYQRQPTYGMHQNQAPPGYSNYQAPPSGSGQYNNYRPQYPTQ